MKSPFDFVDSANNSVKTNNFDWSHVFNLTTDIGKITPVFCQLMPAHSSLSGVPRLGLSFMPMVFPLQSRMSARLSFFKIPLRTLWKDYKDFVGNFREGLEEPYHNITNATDFESMFNTGELMDYFGVPTTIAGDFGSVAWSSFDEFLQTNYNSYSTLDTSKDKQLNLSSFPDGFSSKTVIGKRLGVATNTPFKLRQKTSTTDQPLTGRFILTDTSFKILSIVTPTKENTYIIPTGQYGFYCQEYNSGNYSAPFNSAPVGGVVFVAPTFKLQYGISQDTTSISPTNCPWYAPQVGENKIKLAAYAARAYEAVYNAFYRDVRNNPYYINGAVQYNQYIPTLDGGPDNHVYKLRYANWEKDSFTTAVQSPQQGIAPLVGITTYQETVTADNGETNVVSRVALVDEDGRKFGVQFTSDEEGLKDVQYTRLAGDRPVAQSRSLIELAQSGISINDLRNVNAYQKFLELNMRQGYSYKNIIEGRFDVKVRYDELQMPEFIGGFSEPVQFGAQSQTVQRSDTGNYADQLGALAGTGGVRRDGKAISVFCDEESIVLGLLVVVPTPIYTQVLPKHFLYRGLLDHFQPEFANIGFQPISYREMCPLQVYNSKKPSDLYDTFGYNRPWYELCQQLDTAHGLFRTQLKNFIMNRTFDEKPELSESFLLIDPEQVNDVFAVTDVTDKIFGAVFFDMTAKLPLSRVSIPRLD